MKNALLRVSAVIRRGAARLTQEITARRWFAGRGGFEQRLRAIEALQSECTNAQRVIAHELVRLTARMNASDGTVIRLATRADVAAVRADAADSLNELKLLCAQEAVDAGAHRSYVGRELGRTSEEWVAHRERIETVLGDVVRRLARLERLVDADLPHPQPMSGNGSSPNGAGSVIDRGTSSTPP